MRKKKINWFGLFILVSIVLSASFFGLKWHKYYQGHIEDVCLEVSHLDIQSQDVRQRPESNKSFSYYENRFRNKDLFKVLGREKTPLAGENVELKPDLEKEISKFEVVGIVSSNGKSKALVKNTESGKTFYCSGGEKIDGFVVKEVLLDRVIFKQGEVIVELRL